MKSGDAIRAGFQALVREMAGDDRNTPDEKSELVRWDKDMTAGGPTTKDQDGTVVQCLRRYILINSNY
jgi:hypothetical protein